MLKKVQPFTNSPSIYVAWILVGGLIFVSGCAMVRISRQAQEAQIRELDQRLVDLSPSVDGVEAAHAAEVAVAYPLELAQEWRAIPPAWFNNMLVNTGIHPHGLCYEWADALSVRLMTLRLETLELHRGVARLGTAGEHSCVVLTACGQDFTNGIVLDAWRHCGKVQIATVAKDKYCWQEVALPLAYKLELQSAADGWRSSRAASSTK